VPRLHAAEPFPRIKEILKHGDYRAIHEGHSALVSIGGSTTTYQAVEAIRKTGGTAILVEEQQALRDQSILARSGLYLELSSAAALSAARELAMQDHSTPRIVVCLGTSHGYKEYKGFLEPIKIQLNA
jgi:threonine synthase